MKQVVASVLWLCGAAGAGQAASLTLLDDGPEIVLPLEEAPTGAPDIAPPTAQRFMSSEFLDLSQAPHPVARPAWVGQAAKAKADFPTARN
ncbi:MULTISPECIES: hypothetical protein [unclassified Meridianimarinicoccus]|uniref:hypothetical protein n=1 Tax=unclassified Meridianimarinicoccus TaxID=2923344 RepID=UPI0018692097|nr:hypothetical protein [Fluviibacterium sp. MJW13]